jgi:hypothetical protein
MHHVRDVEPKEHGVSKDHDGEILESTKLATSLA